MRGLEPYQEAEARQMFLGFHGHGQPDRKKMEKMGMTCIELCAGAGGQALGLEEAGFEHLLLVDNDKWCCSTLQLNRPSWNVVEADLRDMCESIPDCPGLDLLAAGLPCPPFSVAGKQLGDSDERDLFPPALALVERLQPKAVMIENVRGFLDPPFEAYRSKIFGVLKELGYETDCRLLNACDFGVPQLRPRVVIVAIQEQAAHSFSWPAPKQLPCKTVGEALLDLMMANRWEGALEWSKKANAIAPTIVGGSKKHGGPDLGPTRAKRAWEQLYVSGHTIAEEPPESGYEGMPRLTVRMVARLQGFPDNWHFSGSKTAAYRQVGNAFPPPVAAAVAKRLAHTLAIVHDRRCAL